MDRETDGKGEQRSVYGAKADFIRSQPDSMSAREIANAAAAQGLEVSVAHVYNLRSKSAKALGDGEEKRDIRARSPDPNYPARLGAMERRIRAAIAELGLRRARQIFEEIADVFRQQ